MSYRIVYHPLAEYDLIEIGDYLSRFYESTFENFMKTFEEKISNLQETPYMASGYRSYRKLVVLKYLVFYKVDEDEKRVRIYRIIHGTNLSELQTIE